MAAFLLYIIAITCVTAFSVLLGHVITSGGKSKKAPFVEKLGGIYNETVDVYFARNHELGLLYTMMNTISSGCTPATNPFVDPIYDVLKLGTRASTESSWLQLKQTLNGTCNFYGLEAMKVRTRVAEGPADICHAYMSGALAYMAVNKLTPQEVNDLVGNLLTAVLVTYPLNLYWKNTLGANWMTDVVITANTGLYAELLAYHNTFHSNPGAAESVRTVATRFCNPYFASDQLAYYNTNLMPHLAFPFEGLVNKRAQSDMSFALQKMLGEMTVPPSLDIKRVFILDPAGNGLPTDPATQLFINSMLPGRAVDVLTDPIPTALNTIAESVYNNIDGLVITGSINATRTPVLVFARYVDDAQTFLSFKMPPNTVMFAFSQDDPGDFLGGEYLGVLLQNAASHSAVSIFDSSISFPFEAYMGADYRAESQVSDFLNLLIGTTVYAGTVAAWDILDTFAMKNTLVGSTDVGGRLERAQLLHQMADEGLATGMQRHSFAMELIQTVTTPSEGDNTTDFGLSSFFGGGNSGPVELPPRWDWREQKGICIPPAQNQGSCNNCWAVSSTNAMSSRLCIEMNPGSAAQAQEIFLSIQQVTACSKGVVTTTDGCDPQQASTGFSFMTGDVTNRQCMSEIFKSRSTNGQCPRICKDGRAPPLAGGVLQGSYTQLQTAKDIKAALLDGPVAVGIAFPTDFFIQFPTCTPKPESFIYPVTTGTRFMTPGGHMMLAIGYDDTTSPPSWIIQNSHGCGGSDGVIQGNGGIIRLAQDVNGILKGKVFWVDYNGYVARPRRRASDPNTVIAQATTTSSTESLNTLIQGAPKAASVPRVYTSSVGCPIMILNQKQSVNQAAIQGCPNSANNLIISSNASTLRPNWFMFAMMLWVCFALNK